MTIKVEHDRNQTTVDGIKDVIMARNFNGVFRPLCIVCSRRRTLFDNSTETEPFLIFLIRDEAVGATYGAKVANILLGAIIWCDFAECVLGWRCLELRESNSQRAGYVAAGVAMADLNSYWSFWVQEQSARL